jgi:hypothetical protein
MNSIPIISKILPTFTLRCHFDRPFHTSRISLRIALFALAALAVVSVAGPAVAREGFALIGTWQHTDRTGIQVYAFNPDGTFYGQLDIPPANGTGSGRIQWQGSYRATGVSSHVSQVQVFRFCASGGGCSSCPPARGEMPGGNGCALAYNMGLTPGVQQQTSVQMQGPNQYVAGGSTFRRVR